MRKLIVVVAFVISSASSMGQGFWETGACWMYSNGYEGYRYSHLSDTIVNGMVIQRTEWWACYEYQGVLHCEPFMNGMNGPFYEYVTLQNDVVLRGGPSFTSWDTLYWLGVPGDRWWPIGSEAFCNGYEGMLQILDTGNVVVQGMSLRTWSVTSLNQNGTPGNWVVATITERIGAVPRNFCPVICSVIYDCFPPSLYHYSDGEINMPLGTTCDIATSNSRIDSADDLRTSPNPGTDQLTITGLSSTPSKVEVRDALGRLVHSQNMAASNAIIPTSAWARGTYFITATDQSGTREVLRWVKQ